MLLFLSIFVFSSAVFRLQTHGFEQNTIFLLCPLLIIILACFVSRKAGHATFIPLLCMLSGLFWAGLTYPENFLKTDQSELHLRIVTPWFMDDSSWAISRGSMIAFLVKGRHCRNQVGRVFIDHGKGGSFKFIAEEQCFTLQEKTSLEIFNRKLRDFLNLDQSPWVYGILTGERWRLEPSIRQQYRDLGILHLLAFSGMHVGFLFNAFHFMLSLGLRLLRILGFLPVAKLLAISSYLNLLAVGLTVFFVLAINASVSAQRALLLIVSYFVSGRIFNVQSKNRQIQIAAVIYILLNPRESISIASCLSWGGFLIVIAGSESLDRPMSFSWLSFAKRQILFLCLSYLLLGVWEWRAFIGNLLFSPFFATLFIASLFEMIAARLELTGSGFIMEEFVETYHTIMGHTLEFLKVILGQEASLSIYFWLAFAMSALLAVGYYSKKRFKHGSAIKSLGRR